MQNRLLSYAILLGCLIPLRLRAEKEIPPDYRLGAEDQILLRSDVVKEIGEKTFRLDQQAEVNVPLIGRVSAGGLTIRELEMELSKQYGRFYVDPEVAITITSYRSEPVSVIGAVGNPGVHQARGRPLLLEMLSAAGGVRTDAGPVVKITRQKKFGTIPLEGVRDAGPETTVAEVSVQSLVEARDPTQNIPIQPFDVISIPRAELVYVVGNVKKAGAVNLAGRRTVSVLEALAMAEGMDARASAKHARILRPAGPNRPPANTKLLGDRQEIPVNLAKILAGKAPDVYLEPNDILFVPNSLAKSVTVRSLETALQVGTGLVIFRR